MRLGVVVLLTAVIELANAKRECWQRDPYKVHKDCGCVVGCKDLIDGKEPPCDPDKCRSNCFCGHGFVSQHPHRWRTSKCIHKEHCEPIKKQEKIKCDDQNTELCEKWIAEKDICMSGGINGLMKLCLKSCGICDFMMKFLQKL